MKFLKTNCKCSQPIEFPYYSKGDAIPCPSCAATVLLWPREKQGYASGFGLDTLQNIQPEISKKGALKSMLVGLALIAFELVWMFTVMKHNIDMNEHYYDDKTHSYGAIMWFLGGLTGLGFIVNGLIYFAKSMVGAVPN